MDDFDPILTFGQPRVDQGHFGQFDLKMTLWVLQYLNGLCHINLDVLATSCRKDNIFEIFGARHANQGQTKYGVYNKDSRLKKKINIIKKEKIK